MIASAVEHALIPALPDQFPKEQTIMKLILIHASIVAHVQIHALLAQFQHKYGIHKGSCSPLIVSLVEIRLPFSVSSVTDPTDRLSLIRNQNFITKTLHGGRKVLLLTKFPSLSRSLSSS
jgi:hypothetical protein